MTKFTVELRTSLISSFSFLKPLVPKLSLASHKIPIRGELLKKIFDPNLDKINHLIS